MLIAVTFFIVLFSIAFSDKCNNVTCPKVPKHYEELGCDPIIPKGQCCPQRFVAFVFLVHFLVAHHQLLNLSKLDNVTCLYKLKKKNKNSWQAHKNWKSASKNGPSAFKHFWSKISINFIQQLWLLSLLQSGQIQVLS
jgi:hypothetical protein